MLDGLSDLEGNALAKVLRRTVVSAVAVGLVAVIVALLLSLPWVALGLGIGLGLAVVNLRFLDAGVAKLQTEGEPDNKVLRRAMGTKSITRLGIITLVCVGLMLIDGGLGVGAVAGLVIFQLLFVFNVGRVVISQGVR
jgi:hypothetical protein